MDFVDLLAYKKGFSLTEHIRRSSRSVCGNIAEAYRKRKVPKHFISKLTDSDGENSETRVWLEFSLACKYIDQTTFDNLELKRKEVGKLINYMILNPGKFGSTIN